MNSTSIVCIIDAIARAAVYNIWFICYRIKSNTQKVSLVSGVKASAKPWDSKQNVLACCYANTKFITWVNKFRATPHMPTSKYCQSNFCIVNCHIKRNRYGINTWLLGVTIFVPLWLLFHLYLLSFAAMQYHVKHGTIPKLKEADSYTT